MLTPLLSKISQIIKLLRSTAKARIRLAAIYCLVKESCVWKLVLDTFRISSAERVPSKCSQSRYIADIYNKDISRASTDILPIYFTKICFKTSKTCGSK